MIPLSNTKVQISKLQSGFRYARASTGIEIKKKEKKETQG